MNEQLPVSRRQALIAATTATAIGAVASVTSAGEKPSGERSKIAQPLKLKITLTDGEIVTLNAAELVIDFGASGQLHVKPNGFLPIRDGGDDQGDKDPKYSPVKK